MSALDQVQAILHSSREELISTCRTVFLVSKLWWDEFTAGQAPGEIDNSQLLTGDGELPSDPDPRTLENDTFVIVAPSVWDLISEEFQGGPEIERFVVGKDVDYTVTPLHFWHIRKTTEELQSPPMTIQVSPNITLRRLKSHMASKLVIMSEKCELLLISYLDQDEDGVQVAFRNLDDREYETVQEICVLAATWMRDSDVAKFVIRDIVRTDRTPSPAPVPVATQVGNWNTNDNLQEVLEADFEDAYEDYNNFHGDGSSTNSTTKMNFSGDNFGFEYESPEGHANHSHYEPVHTRVIQPRFDTEEIEARINAVLSPDSGEPRTRLRLRPLKKIAAEVQQMYEEIKGQKPLPSVVRQ